MLVWVQADKTATEDRLPDGVASGTIVPEGKDGATIFLEVSGGDVEELFDMLHALGPFTAKGKDLKLMAKGKESGDGVLSDYKDGQPLSAEAKQTTRDAIEKACGAESQSAAWLCVGEAAAYCQEHFRWPKWLTAEAPAPKASAKGAAAQADAGGAPANAIRGKAGPGRS